ncbi:hypothetical protein H0H92_006827 [Tricholoma furcatifolium]|nr:hypothetical protein H0H92_006827 [Tricholoma furcatifolium]
MKLGRRKLVDWQINRKTFISKWWSWWRTMKNVDSEDENQDEATTYDDTNWCALLVPGVSGLFLVVLGLAWWGHDIGAEGRATRTPMGWASAVREVTRVLWESRDHYKGKNMENEAAKKNVASHDEVSGSKVAGGDENNGEISVAGSKRKGGNVGKKGVNKRRKRS